MVVVVGDGDSNKLLFMPDANAMQISLGTGCSVGPMTTILALAASRVKIIGLATILIWTNAKRLVSAKRPAIQSIGMKGGVVIHVLCLQARLRMWKARPVPRTAGSMSLTVDAERDDSWRGLTCALSVRLDFVFASMKCLFIIILVVTLLHHPARACHSGGRGRYLW